MIKACASKSAFVTILLVSFAFLESQVLTQVPSEDLARSQERGRKIYLKGESIDREIRAVLGSGEGEFSAQLFPCANCHGQRGTGSSEGGLRPPSINWNALFSPNRSALTGQTRGPYDEESLRRAITAGVDPGGRKLHPGMPRYNLTASQATDLLAYLKILGDRLDSDPGLSADTIKVGAALPMTGPTAGVGEDIKRALTAYFAEVNSQGGIYGRSLELVIADSKADPAETAKATRRLIEADEVFALVGSFEPGGNRVNDGFLQKNEVPLIGPVAFSPRSTSTTNRQTFYLLPSFFDQARTLVDFAVRNKGQVKAAERPSLAAICSKSEFDQDALDGLKTQAAVYGLELSTEHRFLEGQMDVKDVVSSLLDVRPDYLFFFGSGNDLLALAGEMERRGLLVPVLTCAAMIGDASFQLPAAVATRSYLSYPALLPDHEDYQDFIALMRKARVPVTSAPLQALAYAAARVLVEAVKDCGRQLSRSALVSSLEGLKNFRTGVLSPISFSPNRRVGTTESCMVRIDAVRKQYVRASNRIPSN